MLHVQSTFHQYLWSSEGGLSAIVFSGSNPLSVNWTQYHREYTGGGGGGGGYNANQFCKTDTYRKSLKDEA